MISALMRAWAAVGKQLMAQHISLNMSPKDKLQKLAPKPIGFNYYSLLYEALLGTANYAANRATQLAYIQSAGANMVRVMLPCYSSAELLTLVHNTGTMPATMTDANLRSTYIAALDQMFVDANTYGIKLHITDFWAQNLIPVAQGETVANGYVSTTTKTAIYMQSAAQWLFNRYKNNPAFGTYSIGNEYPTDAAGITAPTPAQLGSFFTAIANVCRGVSNSQLITSDLTVPAIGSSNTRETIDQAAIRYATVFSGLDAYCFHFYSDIHNYVGRSSVDAAAYANSTTTTLGYEGVPALIASLKSLADAANKPLILGEFGVNTGNESDANSVKKKRILRSVSANADYGMIWNVQNSVIAGTSGQNTWYIQPATTRGNTFLSLARLFNNSVRKEVHQKSVAVSGLRARLEPSVYMSSTRTAGAVLTATSTAAHQSSNYAILGWIRIDAALNAFEFISRFVDASNFNGFNLVGSATAGAGDFYFDFRAAAGSAGNTAGRLPPVVDLTFHHYACSWETLESGTAITIWLDGVYWQTYVPSVTLTPITVGSNLRLLGDSSGAPVSMQDFCVATSITNEDVWKHMRGEVLPQSLLHVRALNNKTIVDLSANRIALTKSADVTVTINE